MIVVRHALQDAVGGALWQQDELRGDDLIVLRERLRGTVVDETIWPERVGGWCAARFVLDGPLVAGPIDLREGDVLVTNTYGDAPARSLERGIDTLTLIWRSDSVGDGSRATGAAARAEVMRPSPLTARSLARLATSVAVDTPSVARAAALDALDALRAAGLRIAPVRELRGAIGEATDGDHEIARAIERVLFPLSAQPMVTDLARELGVSERHARRRVNGYFARYHRGAATWREYVHGMRLMLGTFFIGQPAATTERVARFLGFGSTTSLCHAFRAARLPSPLAVQRALIAA